MQHRLVIPTSCLSSQLQLMCRTPVWDMLITVSTWPVSLQKGQRRKGACIFNFTGVTSQQSFFVNRSGDSDVASRCEITRAFANNTDYIWSAFDNVGEVPVTVELIAVDSQDENNFTCLLLLSGRHMQSLIPRPYSTLPLCIHIKRRVLLLLFSLCLFSFLLFFFFFFSSHFSTFMYRVLLWRHTQVK